MADDDNELPSARASAIRHVLGERLDDLSIRDFDERIALLRAEIERLEAAKRHKETALSAAGSIFKR